MTKTTRLLVERWNDPDPLKNIFSRENLDDSHENMEERCAVFLKGPISQRPKASAANIKGLYLSTDENSPYGVLYYSNGTVWTAINSPLAATSATPGATVSAGSSTSTAKADHVHSMPPFATTTAPVGSSTPSSATAFSRGDHVHALSDAFVTAGTIAPGAISNSNMFATDVVDAAAIANQNVTRSKIVDSQRIPVGTIFSYAGTTAPPGWMMCEGGVVATSSPLGTVLVAMGSPYNTGGEPGGTVRVPNLRQRIPRGNVSGGSFNTPAYGGSNTLTVTTGAMPQHSHGNELMDLVDAVDHIHGAGTVALSNGSINHIHTLGGHTHSITPANVGRYSFGALLGYFGNVWAFRIAGDGTHGVPTTTGGNCDPSEFGIYTSWSTNTASGNSGTPLDPVTGGPAQVAHGHPFTSATTGEDGGHSHSFSGSTANAGNAAAVDITPEYVSVGYIIKL